MKRTIVLAAAAAFTISACSGLKDALNAHTDWVARAGSTEFTVAKLSNLLGKSRAPIRKDIAKSVGYTALPQKMYDQATKKYAGKQTGAWQASSH